MDIHHTQGPRLAEDRGIISRLLPWSSKATGQGVASPSGNGKRPHADTESKSIDFFGDLSGGRVIRFDHAVPGNVETVRRNTAYAAAIYCYVAIRYRAENVAEPPLRVVEETEDGEEFVEDHPLSRLLEDPSPDYDMGELIELTQTYWDIGGDALWTKDESLLGSTARLTPFQAREYDVHQTRDRILGRFEVKTTRGPKPFDPDDVVYFRYPNPANRQRGLSPTDVALSWLNLGQRTRATIKGLLSNAVFPSVVISPHQDWHPEPDEYQFFQDTVEAYHAGPANAGKPFIALGGSKVARVAMALRDLLPEELLDRVEANVAAAYRIPPIVLGYLVGLKNSPWSQMEQAHRQAYSDAIQPLWRRWEKALSRQLLRGVDDTPGRRIAFDTSAVAALQDDESQKIEDAKAATYWTLNQRLVHSGQPPLPDGDERGDWIEAMANPLGGLNPFASDATGGRGGDGSAGETGAAAAETKLAGEPGDRRWKWSRFDLMTKAQEPAWVRDVAELLEADRSGVLELTKTDAFAKAWERATEALGGTKEAEAWGAELKSVLAAPPEDFAALDETKAPPSGDPKEIAALIELLSKRLDIDAWHERIEPLVASTGRTALKELAAELKLTFSVLEPTLLEYTREEAGWLIGRIDTTTRHRIAAELKAGLAEGETVSELRERLRASEGFGKARAELIARTETTRVTNGSQRTGMSDFQLANPTQVTEKSWLSARDSRVRPEHDQLDDGSWVGINETFANGLTEPGEPNCRCSLLYRIRED